MVNLLFEEAESSIKILALEKGRQRGVNTEILSNDVSVNDLPPVSALTNYFSGDHFDYIRRPGEGNITMRYYDGINQNTERPFYGTNHSKIIIIDNWIGAVMSWKMDGRSMGYEGHKFNLPAVNQKSAFIFAINPTIWQQNGMPNPVSDLIGRIEKDREYSRDITYKELLDGRSLDQTPLIDRIKMGREKKKGMCPNKDLKTINEDHTNLFLGKTFPGPNFFKG